jgi:hypothetical protein
MPTDSTGIITIDVITGTFLIDTGINKQVDGRDG